MGIRNLNKFLRDNCQDSIRCIDLSELNGKKIVIDISIYLYKFEATGALLENMYVMLSTFNYYNIVPIFIFDGKPPPEKKDLLLKRKANREEAQKEYDKLKEQLNNLSQNDDDKREILASMDVLKKQIVQIKKEHIEKVKDLIRAYGATYYDAPGEADELCAMLVMKKKVWACLSDDMDLFVYGCPRVLRYLSLMKHQAVLYYTNGILEALKMTHKEFKEICILSGTDYNSSNDTDKNNLQLTIKHFNKYKMDNKNVNDNNNNFYEWLKKNTDCITNSDLLNKINEMFNLECNQLKLDVFKNVKIINGPIRQEQIQNIMSEEDFMFCKKRY